MLLELPFCEHKCLISFVNLQKDKLQIDSLVTQVEMHTSFLCIVLNILVHRVTPLYFLLRYTYEMNIMNTVDQKRWANLVYLKLNVLNFFIVHPWKLEFLTTQTNLELLCPSFRKTSVLLLFAILIFSLKNHFLNNPVYLVPHKDFFFFSF